MKGWQFFLLLMAIYVAPHTKESIAATLAALSLVICLVFLLLETVWPERSRRE